MNDPVVERRLRIDGIMRYTNLTQAQAAARVDAEIAEEEAKAHAYVELMRLYAEHRANAA